MDPPVAQQANEREASEEGAGAEDNGSRWEGIEVSDQAWSDGSAAEDLGSDEEVPARAPRTQDVGDESDGDFDQLVDDEA